MPEFAIDLRKVGGAFSVDEGARRLIHYRYAEIACMEDEAGWVATLAAPKLKIRTTSWKVLISLSPAVSGVSRCWRLAF